MPVAVSASTPSQRPGSDSRSGEKAATALLSRDDIDEAYESIAQSIDRSKRQQRLQQEVMDQVEEVGRLANHGGGAAQQQTERTLLRRPLKDMLDYTTRGDQDVMSGQARDKLESLLDSVNASIHIVGTGREIEKEDRHPQSQPQPQHYEGDIIGVDDGNEEDEEESDIWNLSTDCSDDGNDEDSGDFSALRFQPL